MVMVMVVMGGGAVAGVCVCVCLDGGRQGCLLSQYSNSHQNTKTAILQRDKPLHALDREA